MESLIGIKAEVMEAKNKTRSRDHHQLLDQVYENLECLELLVADMPEIRECQNFEPSVNSIRGMLHDFRCLASFEEHVCRTFCRNLSMAIESYRELALYVPNQTPPVFARSAK